MKDNVGKIFEAGNVTGNSVHVDEFLRAFSMWLDWTPFYLAADMSSSYLGRSSKTKAAANKAVGKKKRLEDKAEKTAEMPAETVVLNAADLPLDLTAAHDPSAQILTDQAVLRLLAEELVVGQRQVETGRVQVRRVTREHVEDVNEPLERVEAEVERVAIGTFVDARPPVRETEDEIIIPIVEEVIVVERKLRLREEVHIRKHRTTEYHREKVLLRSHDAEIRRLPPKPTLSGD